MKKFLSLTLTLVTLLSALSLAGCGKKETLKIGLGVDSYFEKVISADTDSNGSAEVTSTFAAVLLDGKGKIVKCAIDNATNTLSFTSDGKYVKAEEFKTKYETGKDYGMVTYGGSEKEWFEQVDAFCTLVEGKTLQDVKSLIASDGKGSDEVVNAGCTIVITDFINALEKAVNNATDSSATLGDTLKLGVISNQTDSKDATEEAAGVNEVDTTVTAAAIKEGKVTAMTTDALQAQVTFDIKGISNVEASTKITTKAEAGDDYGMVAYGTDLNGDGTIKEWYEQAEEFDKACVGKTADEISALALDTGYGVDTLQSAGCTINIDDIVKSAVKAVK